MAAEQKNKRRISDISFCIDGNLAVSDANRNLFRLLDSTDEKINLAAFLDKADQKNLKHFLKNYAPENNNAYCIVTLHLAENTFTCILHVDSKQDEKCTVTLQELSYSQEKMERTILENREYTSLLNEYTSYFILYDGSKFRLKNTKDMSIDVYRGDKTDFVIYFINFFKINTENDATLELVNLMFADIEKGTPNRQYRLLLDDSSNILVKVLHSRARNSFATMGFITQSKVQNGGSNTYVEKRDGLTELFNKKTITDLATKKINISRTPVALFIIDVDKFKDFNDNFGHAYGDKVLVTVAKVIREAVGDKGISGRIGGDEFMCVVDTTDEEDVRSIARNIKQGVQWNIQATDPDQVVTCSIGIARAPIDKDNYDDLFETADRALYIAKMRGRNCYIIYKPEIHDSIVLEQQESDRNTSSGKMFMEGALSEMSILQEYHNQKDGDYIRKALYMLMEYITVHKICIYTWTQDSNAFAIYDIIGKDDKDIRIPHLNNTQEQYFKYYNSYGFLHLDNVNNLDTMDKDRFHMYLEDDVASTLEILWTSEDKQKKILICFDVYRPARTFQKHKIVFTLLMSTLISQELSSTMEQ